MTVQTNLPPDGSVATDGDQSQKTNPKQPTGTIVKEQEPNPPSGGDQEKKLLSEIIETSQEIDEKKEKEVQGAIAEARLARPEPIIPPDVADSGVKSPEEEAEKVVKEGASFELPLTEEQYKKGLHQKVAGAVVESVVYGVSSLFGLATWVGRMIKIAHEHTMRVVFRKQGVNR